MNFDTLLNPTTVLIIGVLMLVELWVLSRVFARRDDRRNVGITAANVGAGVCLMLAVASEMADQPTAFTGACLIGALIAHCIEIWQRLR